MQKPQTFAGFKISERRKDGGFLYTCGGLVSPPALDTPLPLLIQRFLEVSPVLIGLIQATLNVRPDGPDTDPQPVCFRPWCCHTFLGRV